MGFQVLKFLIIDNSGQLLKHKLDILVFECGKGDVKWLKKKYFKKIPDLIELNPFFVEESQLPKPDHFIVIIIWHEIMDGYNKHTFETYHTWKDNSDIDIYFLNLDID